LASLEDAVVGAKIAAVLLALVGGWLGTRYGQMIGIKDRVKSGGWWRGICGAVMGAILGALLGVMLVAFKGTLLCGLAGGLLGWFLPARDKSIRMVKGVIGGAMLGVVVQGWHHAAEDAFTGMWIGGLAGAIAGPLLMLLLM